MPLDDVLSGKCLNILMSDQVSYCMHYAVKYRHNFYIHHYTASINPYLESYDVLDIVFLYVNTVNLIHDY